MNAYALGKYAAEDAVKLDRGEASDVAKSMGRGDMAQIMKALKEDLGYMDKRVLTESPKLGIGGHAWRMGAGAGAGAAGGAGIGALIKKFINKFHAGSAGARAPMGRFAAGGSIPGAIIGAIMGLVKARRKQKELRDPLRAELISRMPGRLGIRMMRNVKLPTQMSIASEMETLGGREKDRIARAIKALALKSKD
jgi:hypothetical protein